MSTTPRLDRLKKELADIRKELMETARKVTPEEFEWRPRPDMEKRTAKGLLWEIGTMERICATWFISGQMLEWDNAVTWSGEDLGSMLDDLQKIRQETLNYLDRCSDEDLDVPRAAPGAWRQYVGAEWPLEDAIRWITRHEYYHLGQLIYNRWLLGHNPYDAQ